MEMMIMSNTGVGRVSLGRNEARIIVRSFLAKWMVTDSKALCQSNSLLAVMPFHDLLKGVATEPDRRVSWRFLRDTTSLVRSVGRRRFDAGADRQNLVALWLERGRQIVLAVTAHLDGLTCVGAELGLVILKTDASDHSVTNPGNNAR